ncbi:hypothetical protein P3T27_000552 [Kitasatospora sp. MAA19]|uniref:DUF6126 family protein n=1 Tax=unclassified Kitasatospora TaxID=2633591 RepID=UPI002476E81E|nr:DUF6126 family protein [Kitasatospora sp. MAA19]MDH6703871.1 hypothetical protein [Kitasatospora sp. MAA19]
MADPTTPVQAATAAAEAAAPAPVAKPAAKTIDAGKWANRRVGIRLVIYTAGIHAFAGFIMLLFELGNRNK